MTTEDMIEDFIQHGMKAYKKNSKGSAIARNLDRHEPVMLDSYEFSYWREWTVYKMCEYLKIIMPDIHVECVLDGNDSAIGIELTDEQQRILNGKLYSFLSGIR